MANNLDWSNVVGKTTLSNGGFFGDIMKVARAHVNDSMNIGELTQAEAGQIYTAVIPGAIKSAIEWELAKRSAEKDLAIKDEELIGKEIDNDILLQQEENYKLDGELKELNISIGKDEKIRKEKAFVIEQEKHASALELNEKAIASAVVDVNKNNVSLEILKDDKLRKISAERRANEIHENQIISGQLSHEKAEKDIEDKESIIKARNEQVIDNRFIKTTDMLSGMLSNTMSGGMLPDKSMLGDFFGYLGKLNGIKMKNMGTVSPSVTYLHHADNTNITYPYGGFQTHDPEARNDYVAYYYTIDGADPTTYDSNGYINGGGTKMTVGDFSETVYNGDRIVQTGGDASDGTPNVVWKRLGAQLSKPKV